MRASSVAAAGVLPDELDVALRGDQSVEGVEQDADRGGKPQALSRFPRAFEQKRPRRLQLLGKRRLLADRRAVGRRQIVVGIETRATARR